MPLAITVGCGEIVELRLLLLTAAAEDLVIGLQRRSLRRVKENTVRMYLRGRVSLMCVMVLV